MATVDMSILLPAFVAGLLVMATHVPLGREVLARGIVFLDLAVAQVAGLGVSLAGALGWEGVTGAPQAAAAVAALVGAGFLHWTERRFAQTQEAVIGVTFVVAACAAMLLVSHDPHGNERLQELMAGQILWTTWADIAPLAAATVAVLVGMRLFRASRLAFYALFALMVTASVQVVGVYLVFASLIIPALMAGPALARAYGAGAAGLAAGLLVSALFDLPAGPAIVCALVPAGWLVGAIGPQQHP